MGRGPQRSSLRCRLDCINASPDISSLTKMMVLAVVRGYRSLQELLSCLGVHEGKPGVSLGRRKAFCQSWRVAVQIARSRPGASVGALQNSTYARCSDWPPSTLKQYIEEAAFGNTNIARTRELCELIYSPRGHLDSQRLSSEGQISPKPHSPCHKAKCNDSLSLSLSLSHILHIYIYIYIYVYMYLFNVTYE